MVRDAYAASGQPQQADGGAAVQPLDLRSSTANLTQELAQLLAQSIAQGQTGKGPSNPEATGSELANLAALVSASQHQSHHQRSAQPSFKDGLSSLSYTRPAPQPAPPPPAAPPAAPPPVAAPPAGSGLMAPPTGGGLLVSEPHDEEPMPIPSTWREPTQGDDDRWYRQQLGAAGLGLVAGLIVVVPAVLWLSGLLGGAQTKAVAAREAASEAAPPVKVAAVKQVKVRVAAASADPGVSAPAPAETVAAPQARDAVAEPSQPRVAAVPPTPAPRPAEPVRSRADELLAQAKRRIESGDITGARSILDADRTTTQTSAALTFLLAETFDPNMLASWQTRGVAANPHRAKSLYKRARELGESRARQRLDWLTVN